MKNYEDRDYCNIVSMIVSECRLIANLIRNPFCGGDK